MQFRLLSVKESFEMDKLIIAAAISIFAVIMGGAFGNIIYAPELNVAQRGYKIEVLENTGTSVVAAKGIPETIDIAQIMAATNAEEGKKVFAKCAVCHTIGKAEANKVGPNLWGIVNRKVAVHEGFAYSEAMKKLNAEGKVWEYETLYRYLYAPKQYVEGTKMAFAGIKKDDERANLIAYLRMQADTPLPLPMQKNGG